MPHFQRHFGLGVFPDKWSEGIIIPIHKKGATDDVNNYRGITLLSCLSKLFTTILNNRITKFCEDHSVISDAQFGFKKDLSTSDAIFTLLNIVQNFLNENKRLYCAFVNLKKCFDSINRHVLWYKLYKSGIQGKLLSIIRDMYSKVSSCVRSHNETSDFFDFPTGLRQGETISPILVSLFLEDLELFLQQDPDSGIKLDQLTIIIILFSGDMVIFGKTQEELQVNIDRLYDYCKTWGLEVNINKTETMVFRKRGGLKNNERWIFNGQFLESVDNFNYLGTVFNYTGTFNLNQEYLSGKALKALYVLLNNCLKYKLKTSILCQLFDAFVGSILNYSSETWGFSKSKAIERIHLKFYKRILQVRTCTSTMAVYGELGRFPMYILRYHKIIKYWFKVLQTENIILKNVYLQSLHDVKCGKRNWVF